MLAERRKIEDLRLWLLEAFHDPRVEHQPLFTETTPAEYQLDRRIAPKNFCSCGLELD